MIKMSEQLRGLLLRQREGISETSGQRSVPEGSASFDPDSNGSIPLTEQERRELLEAARRAIADINRVLQAFGYEPAEGYSSGLGCTLRGPFNWSYCHVGEDRK